MKRILIPQIIAVVLLLSACAAPALPPADPPPAQNPTPQAAVDTNVQATLEVAESAAEPAGGAPAVEPSITIPPPACTGELTPAQMEGPYYSPGSPETSDLLGEGAVPGTPLLIYGWVLDQACNPIPGARVEFWQADAEGEYDNEGYTLRGHVLTDENGYYEVRTIAPGVYPGRPPHIHAKVLLNNEELLTTQLYFPGSEDSEEVRTNPALLVTYQAPNAEGLIPVLFSFVVAR